MKLIVALLLVLMLGFGKAANARILERMKLVDYALQQPVVHLPLLGVETDARRATSTFRPLGWALVGTGAITAGFGGYMFHAHGGSNPGALVAAGGGIAVLAGIAVLWMSRPPHDGEMPAMSRIPAPVLPLADAVAGDHPKSRVDLAFHLPLYGGHF